MTVTGCPARKPRADGEEFPERGDHLCGYLLGHKGEHVCACAKPRKSMKDVIPGRWAS